MRRLVAAAFVATALIGIVWLSRASRSPMPTDTTNSNPAAREPSAPEPHFAESDQHPLPDILIDPAIVIDKSTRSLVVYSDGEPVKRYRVGLGAHPLGDKSREGDGRTPEGEFYVCTKNEESRFHRALGISYPNAESAERGLAEGIINKREYRQIADAIIHFRQPPWKTALGGEIMIHGSGSDSDWTQGCIAVTDSEIEELFIEIPLGTPVDIRP